MKQVINMSRLVNQLEKMFRALNADFFDGALEMPVITVTPSSRSYAHYTTWNAWETKQGGKREINVASGTLNRPLEDIAASLLHEMCHMLNDTILNVQDTSRGGTYHNKQFARVAADHGLTVEHTDKYGWAKTAPDDALLDWILTHDEYREIELWRTDPTLTAVGIGAHAAHGGTQGTTPTRSSSRRYRCPCCGAIVRATRSVNIICGDCLELMVEG
jgi:hypothetical protein